MQIWTLLISPKTSMTAWEEIQLDWAKNTESNNVSGILLWDLSAAFDTLDYGIFLPPLTPWMLKYFVKKSMTLK